jgi:tRNA pseudouridine13 synthase
LNAGDPLPLAWGGAPLTGIVRSTPDDFVVEEQLGFAASGAGEHVLLWVEKRGQNTEWVARQLARFAGVAPVAVGYAGLKDRHAVTRQHFSVQLPGRADPDWAAAGIEGVTVLSAARHARKLPRGALQGNRFELVLRGVSGDHDAALRIVESIRTGGVPNYYGEQRFGRGGDNVAQARSMFAGRQVERAERSILLSAARSELFNRVLARRVREGSWGRLVEGEVCQLDGTGSIFGPQPIDEALLARCTAGDIHPTGPLWGAGELRCGEPLRALEQAVADAEPELTAGLIAAGLKQERRALRVRVGDLEARFDGDALHLAFSLPAGAYATGVVREICAS